MKIFFLLLFVILGPVGAVYADSDGYYCVGRGYLAYQFGMASLSVAPHRLYVLRIGTTAGIAEPAPLELPQFQVHGLRCGEGWIDVASFTAIYHVTLDANSQPSRYDVRPFGEGQKVPPELRPQGNLGMLSPAIRNGKSERVSLGMKQDGGQFVLEMTGQPIPNEQCLMALTTRIVETDRNGREIRERIIYQGRGRQECGGGRDVNGQGGSDVAAGTRSRDAAMAARIAPGRRPAIL
jgi:hypothetical protein